MKLPRSLEAIVPERKIRGYLLSDNHPVGKTKAKYFRSLGYSTENAVLLQEDLIEIATANEVTETISTPYGTRYVVDGELKAPTGIWARVRTVWMLETAESIPRFVTAYPASAKS